MSAIPISHAIYLAAAMFTLGLLGVMTRRNLIFVLMSLEVMLNAAGLAFIAAGARWAEADGQVFFLLILTLAAAEVAIGLALALAIHQSVGTLSVERLNRMRG